MVGDDGEGLCTVMPGSADFLKQRAAEFREKGIAIDLAIENGEDNACCKWKSQCEYLAPPDDKDRFLSPTEL